MALVYVPQSAPESQRPLVLAFHGAGSNADDMVEFSGLCSAADRHGFVVAFPNGTGRTSTALSWNAGNVNVHAARHQVDDVGFSTALIDELQSSFGIDTEAVYSVGMSNGGLFCYRLALEAPERIAAIGVVGCAAVDFDAHPPSPMPIIHFHGTEDEFVPFEGGVGKRSFTRMRFESVPETVRFWAKHNGCTGPPTHDVLPAAGDDTHIELEHHVNCHSGCSVHLVKIVGGGHTWPGQPSPLPMLGVSTMQVDANEMMWAFFKQHRKSA